MKLLYFNDPHFRDTTPENRLEENFLEMQSSKLQDIALIAHNKGIKDIIIGGDIFDKWNTSYETTKRIMNIIGTAFTNMGITLHTIIGNHDIIGYNIETLKQTSLGILQDISVSIYGGSTLKSLNIFDTGDIFTRFIHTRKNEDINTYFEFDGYRKPNIIISHDTITDTDNLPFPHIYYEKLDGCADVVLCSHYHKPFIVKSKNTTFINAGAMTRLSIGDDWEPGVVIFDYDSDSGISNIERVCIASAKSYNDIFKTVEKIAKKIELPTFNIESHNIIDKIIQSGKDRNIEVPVINESILRINNALAEEQK